MQLALAKLEKHGSKGEFTCQIDAVPAAEWDQIAGDFEDLNYDQIACYSAGQWGDRVSHLLLRRDRIPVAGARVAIITLPRFSRGLAFLRFGPFWRRRGHDADIGMYRAAIGALVQEYCIRQGHFLTVIPRPNPEFYQQECRVLADFGFSIRRPFPDPNRYLVDLSLDEETQRQSLDQKWRYNLRQALANDFEIRLCESDADVRTFQSLHAGMVTRKGFYNADMVHLLPELAAQLPEGSRPRIVLAFHQGRAVVGAAIAILGDTAYYVFGGSDNASLSLKGGYALQWWIIKWLSGQKVRAKRDEMELSRLELSRRLGVSPRMLDRYESDSEVTLQRGFRIHEVLGEEVFLPVELFDIPLDYAQPQDEISLKYSELGFRVQEFRKAPFDVIARQDRELIFTEMGKVHPEMQSLSRLLDADNLVIFDERAPKDKDLPSMRKEEFLELQEARELVKFLREF